LRRWLPAVWLLLLVLLAVFGVGNATAHAVLLRTIPPPRQSLPQPPPQVVLLFSEPIDPVFSSVHVADATDRTVDSGDSHVDENNDHQLVVSLPPSLPNGVYTVNWRSLSTIDVHPDQGQYPVYIGVAVPAAAALTPLETAENTATPATTFGRWWFYLAASLFGGVLALWKLVLSQVFASEPAAVRSAARTRSERAVLIGGLLLILGTLFTAVAQAAAAADVPLTSALGQPLADLLLRGRFASIWWPRLGLEVASLALIAFGGLDGLAADCALATLPAVLLTSSLTSHGAALPGSAGAGIIVDWLHILGATAWVGGLVGLLLVLRIAQRSSNGKLLPTLVLRFGRLALLAVVLVVLSGSIQAAIELGSWSGLVESAYGRLILLKIGLLVVMLVVAATNDFRGRRATDESSAVGRRLSRGARVELALGVVVLAVAAILSGTPPNRAAVPGPNTAQTEPNQYVRRRTGSETHGNLDSQQASTLGTSKRNSSGTREVSPTAPSPPAPGSQSPLGQRSRERPQQSEEARGVGLAGAAGIVAGAEAAAAGEAVVALGRAAAASRWVRSAT
jgi:copper transport protein